MKLLSGKYEKPTDIYLTLFCFVTFYRSIDGSLHKQLKYFETLTTSDINYRIVKRDAYTDNALRHMSFKAFGRDFHLLLAQNTDVLSSSFKAISVDGNGREEPVAIDHSTFYKGRISDQQDSHAIVHFEDGLLTATIQTKDDTYIIEPSWRHLPENKSVSMIAYRGCDVNMKWSDKDGRKESVKICGYVKEEPNITRIAADDREECHREKRQAESYKFDSSRTRCPLLLVADYRFYRSMGGSSKKKTITYLINLIDRVHKIYTDIEWRDHPSEPGFKGMGFIIEEIIVHSEPTQVDSGQQNYNMELTTWDARDLLEIFSRDPKHRRFCLAHLFTDIKFEGGILGLAYVGSSRKNSVGGICTPEYFKNGYTLYLNSGLSSSKNHYGKRVITREADLVTAHEFGHNWGSEHDPDNPECSPDSSKGGSFLMYTYSVSGYDMNNKRFSPCSLRSIKAVLMAKSYKCFKEPQESFCGNSRVERGEQCDAGLISTGAEDLCCEKNCTLKPKAICSDKNSPCCRDCAYVQPGFTCRDANPNTCEKEAKCTGESAECPPAAPEENETACVDKGKCFRGHCKPFCETIGMRTCMCDSPNFACRRCCRQFLNSSCILIDQNDVLPDGTPCFHGLCSKGQCEKTVQDIVERIWDIIEDININSVIKFLNDNIVGTVVIISIVVWIPASCLISYIDRKRRREDLKEEDWWKPNNNTLIHPSDKKKLRSIWVPRAKVKGSGSSSAAANAMIVGAMIHPSENRISKFSNSSLC